MTTTFDALAWLAAAGARFALPWGRTKDRLSPGWQSAPATLAQAQAHARSGDNVSILTGQYSGGLVALDRDIAFGPTVAMLGQLGQTAKVTRDNAPERGKLLYRVVGDLPPTRVYKLHPKDKHPAAELLSTGRHALIPPSEFGQGHYQLTDQQYGILDLSYGQIEHIWRLVTGQTFDKVSSNTAQGVDKNELRRQVAEAWPTLRIFQHHGRAANGTLNERGETRVLGNGGLLIAENGQWYSHGDGVGGDEFDAWAFCTEGRIVDRADRRHFPRILAAMAEAAGLGARLGARVYTNGTPPVEPPAEPEPLAPAPTGRYAHTDLGNARRLVAQHGADLRYCYAWDKWLVWDGCRWRPDDTGEVERRAKQTVAAIYAEAASCADEETRKAIAKWAIRSEAKALITNMIALARSEPGIPVRTSELDADPWSLNLRNGTLDLRSGTLRPHRREDLITKLAPVEWDREAIYPTWITVLDRLMAKDSDLIGFLKRAIGYSLTALTTAHQLFFAYGGGNNGKSTFFEAIAAVLGDYAQRAPTEMIMLRDRSSIPNDVARLLGARMVVCAEVEDGQRLAESKVKDLTGGDTVAARFLHAEWFDFKPTHKLWLYGNHKPVIRGTDNGIWRRIALIPFLVTIPPNEVNAQLPAMLAAEAAGILAWAVEGCIEWQRDGLQPPAAVMAATQEYRSESDLIGAFLAECTTQDPRARARANQLYKTYTTWAEQNGETPVTSNRFGRSLGERGYQKETIGGGFISYRGIGLLERGDKDL